MPGWDIVYRHPGVPPERVAADEVRHEGAFLVFVAWTWAVGGPRAVVVLRAPHREIASVWRVAAGAGSGSGGARRRSRPGG